MSEDAWDLISNERATMRRGAGGLVDALVQSVQAALNASRCMSPRYVNLEHFVLEHGHYWEFDTKRPLPRGFAVGKQGDCHANASKLATEHNDLVYVEGYVLSTVVPIRHAWIQLPSGEAVDTTFAGLERVEVAQYFGVPFRTDFLLLTSAKARAFLSLIDDWQAGWPLLSVSAEELAEVLWAPP